MKIAQTECNNSTATESGSAKVITTTTVTSLSSKPNRIRNVENVCDTNANKDAVNATEAIAKATTAPTTTTMTDERNSNSNQNSSNNNNNNSSSSSSSSSSSNSSATTSTANSGNNTNERLIVEAAKILLKNGLNGSNAAAAAAAAAAVATASLLSAATFQLPAAPPLATAATTNASTTTTTTRGTLFQPPPPAHLGASIASGISVASNGVSSAVATATNSTTTSTFSSTTQQHRKAMAATTALAGAGCNQPPVAHLGVGVKSTDMGVIDYTLSASSSTVSNNNSKAYNSSISKYPGGGGSNDVGVGRNSISTSSGSINSAACGSGFGGRLQFFKDGKVILELARSREGDKGGWVSVPRKLFRSPSATSSTVTPTLATSTAYPKNESSTSLSFSDDNSSIQSSPWQRDHCWKQTSPRRGISKCMSLLYQRPKGATLTRKALLAAQRKRRRPYEATSDVDELYEASERSIESQPRLEAEERVPSTLVNSEDCKMLIKVEAVDTENNTEAIAEEDGCSTSSTATLTGGNDCIDAATTAESKTPTPASPESETKPNSADAVKKEEITLEADEKQTGDEVKDPNAVEKMNTSEDEEAMSVSIDEPQQQQEVKLNGSTEEEHRAGSNSLGSATEKVRTTNTRGGEDKRLKKPKTRAKLTTIIQKLIDRMPARLVHASTRATPQSSGAGGANSTSNSLTHKVSPPTSSSTTSRLVEYPQQHVSPRKRILREFEKVSLEDNSPSAGGKRSRAKSNASSSAATSPYRNAKSPPNRAVNSGGTASATSASTTTTANGPLRSSSTAKTESSTPSSSTPTRLNSSYSIHALLSGGNSSSSSKKATDQAIISNFNYQQQSHYTDPSYLRSMLASPKSPDGSLGVGGKSPSNSAAKKRSPPYASPMRELHARSPTVTNTGTEYGRRSPHTGVAEMSAANYKMRFAAEHGGTSHAPSHHLQQHQGFYSPFMMSPKYVPAPNTSVSPNSSATHSSGPTRSPRHASAFNATSSSTASASTSTNIPNVSGSIGGGGSGGGTQRDLSPQRMSSASPRDSTPRTVPKKTASIRRQFASPTASTTSSCPSPSERTAGEEASASSGGSSTTAAQQQQQQLQQGRKTPYAGTSTHLLQRASPSGGVAGTVPSPLHYYMYPPTPNGSSSPHALTAPGSAPVNSSAAAAAAAAAAYIPSVVSSPYCHPYISALAALRHNPMWMHHAYAGAAPHMLPPHHPAASPTARLSPPFQGFGYNGMNAAAMAAAMQQQQQHHHMLTTSGMLHGGLGMPMSLSPLAGAGRTLSPKSADNTAEPQAGPTKYANAMTMAAALGTIYPNSIKDEHSSDVPLNLSKH